MEAALKSFLQDTLGEYVAGLENVSGITLSEPILLKDLALKPEAVNELVEDIGGKCPFSVTSGKIGSVSMKANWRGNLIINASDLELNLGFSAFKAMQCAMAADEDDPEEQQAEVVPQLGPPPPAQWCSKHDASEKREKGEPLHRNCKSCGTGITSNYRDWSLCPFCSSNQHRCMICGDQANSSGKGADPHAHGPPLQPSTPQGPPPPAVWCPAHATSEQRPKIEPECRPCHSCGAGITTNYQDFALCPHCSSGQHRCMICGANGLETKHEDSPSKGVSQPFPPDLMMSQRPPVGPPPDAVGPPPDAVWCARHDTSEKRPKGETKHRPCQACGVSVTSNYEDFALCQGCSAGKSRCMICADHAVARTSVWCANHDRSEKRPKSDTTAWRSCTNCPAVIQTNYVHFTLCPDCSAGQYRCMACGESAEFCANPLGSSPSPMTPCGAMGSSTSQRNEAWVPSPCRIPENPGSPMEDMMPPQPTPTQFITDVPPMPPQPTPTEFITDVQPRQSSRPPEPPKPPYRPKATEYSLLCGLNDAPADTPWQPHPPQPTSSPSCSSWSQQMAAKFNGGRTGHTGSGRSLLQQFTAKVGGFTTRL